MDLRETPPAPAPSRTLRHLASHARARTYAYARKRNGCSTCIVNRRTAAMAHLALRPPVVAGSRARVSAPASLRAKLRPLSASTQAAVAPRSGFRLALGGASPLGFSPPDVRRPAQRACCTQTRPPGSNPRTQPRSPCRPPYRRRAGVCGAAGQPRCSAPPAQRGVQPETGEGAHAGGHASQAGARVWFPLAHRERGGGKGAGCPAKEGPQGPGARLQTCAVEQDEALGALELCCRIAWSPPPWGDPWNAILCDAPPSRNTPTAHFLNQLHRRHSLGGEDVVDCRVRRKAPACAERRVDHPRKPLNLKATVQQHS